MSVQMSDSDLENAGVPLIEDISDSDDAANRTSSTKRKRDNEAQPESNRSKKKRKNTKAPKDLDDGLLDIELSVNHAIGKMDRSLMADHIAQRTRRFKSELSIVEMEDIHIAGSAIRESSTWEKPRTLDVLPLFLDKYAAPRRKKKKGPKLADATEEKGSPHTIVVAASGIRAADLTRALRQFQTREAFVTKLFAKHIKLKEAIDTVQKTRMNIGVGTPQRLIDLLDNGALSAEKLERVVIDASHIDQKKRGILDMKETHVPLVEFLARPELKKRYALSDDEKLIELIFF